MLNDTHGADITDEQYAFFALCRGHGPVDEDQLTDAGRYVVSGVPTTGSRRKWIVMLRESKGPGDPVVMLEYSGGRPCRFRDVRHGQTFELD